MSVAHQVVAGTRQLQKDDLSAVAGDAAVGSAGFSSSQSGWVREKQR